MTDSVITTRADGTVASYVGPDAVEFFRVKLLHSAINLWIDTGGHILPTRGATISKMLAQAGAVTGKTYKRGQAPVAREDLFIWLSAMNSALPHETSKE